MHIAIATDAWEPQVNGVVRTYQRLCVELQAEGVEVSLLTPKLFATVPCPTYPEIRLALAGRRQVGRWISERQPDVIHIATEGPIGWAARSWCVARGLPFTTAFHTRFADYVSQRFRVPSSVVWRIQRTFHTPAAGTMVAAPSLAAELRQRGFGRLVPWTRGVDTTLFRPRSVRQFGSGTVFLYTGRVAIEKNLEAFLDLELPGRKVVVGDGPARPRLERRYPDALFVGRLEGEALAVAYASADVFVMPSRTETFGVVILEAMASGLPVAAYPVTGPLDVVTQGESGVLDEDLGRAARSALALNRSAVVARAQAFSWSACARMFLRNVEEAVLAPRRAAHRAHLSRTIAGRNSAGA